jgi:hypothetical protein
MRTPALLSPIALAVGVIIVAPAASAREPTSIKACGTISQPGSYELANNLTATSTDGNCLVITTGGPVTIDLAGFLITGNPSFPIPNARGTGILADTGSVAVRNGSISGFDTGINLSGVVEGLRIFSNRIGGVASGIVRDNIVTRNGGISGFRGGGLSATGIVTGNYVHSNDTGLAAGQGSTVIGNTVTDNNNISGLTVACPSNVTNNTVINRTIEGNFVLEGEGCTNTNNVVVDAVVP